MDDKLFVPKTADDFIGLDQHTKDKYLVIASYFHNIDAVQIMLKAGANVDTHNGYPMSKAKENWDVEMQQLLSTYMNRKKK